MPPASPPCLMKSLQVPSASIEISAICGSEQHQLPYLPRHQKWMPQATSFYTTHTIRFCCLPYFKCVCVCVCVCIRPVTVLHLTKVLRGMCHKGKAISEVWAKSEKMLVISPSKTNKILQSNRPEERMVLPVCRQVFFWVFFFFTTCQCTTPLGLSSSSSSTSLSSLPTMLLVSSSSLPTIPLISYFFVIMVITYHTASLSSSSLLSS